MMGNEIVVYWLLCVAVALVVGLFGCCCIFAVFLVAAGKLDSNDADYEWNANSGDVNSYAAVAGDVVVAAVGACCEGNKTKTQMKDYLKS